ncbi:NADPH-dependent FMN reductase [Bradyrhizobium brasilense]|uniref:NAD(P)H-dependent oxidoreductase n=1 Tax=Bradyrhizobium brasilense TaxID=1419277 RepID=A0ABY8JAJ7_9BRAD|nr:NAD(P)H-dependent oxidoreductase [Bradyrhizobium brasilense]WFU62587.1 NAD(P)H-dependent oxidoreductase [Bradyrhizobium brasilense]
MIRISLVVGNPKPASRTRRIGEELVERLFPSGSYELVVVDLADYADNLFKWPSEELAKLNAAVAASHVAVFASPTYKATFTGLLKAFLDRYPASGLRGVVAVPLMTGADLGHSMGPVSNLTPLLIELGAVVPVRGLYFVTAHMDQLDIFLNKMAGEVAQSLRAVASVASRLRFNTDSSGEDA